MTDLLVTLGMFAADAPTGQTPPSGTEALMRMLPMLAAFALMFYFLLIRPQSKKAKEHAALLQSIRPGDKVMTSGGVLGVILTVKEKSISIRSADSKLEIQKSAVSEVLERGGEASQS